MTFDVSCLHCGHVPLQSGRFRIVCKRCFTKIMREIRHTPTQVEVLDWLYARYWRSIGL